MSESSTKPTSETVEPDERDLLTRLTDAGEEAMGWIRTDVPGAKRALQAASDLRARVDELAKRVSGMDELEQRVAALEEQLAGLRKAEKAAPKPKA
jgi:uncharacterized protein involved in exopolysaccharide biosynthesis